jgi:hypothetical protein
MRAIFFNCFSVLLIAPVGIEMKQRKTGSQQGLRLLIAPVGIEIVDVQHRLQSHVFF